ncbi:hypothetical protein Leryth_000340 [Lithospermum erythrorhizon]|nr:hypothetical protein Leryth_000340 [Lithospermum erythrorhizon]
MSDEGDKTCPLCAEEMDLTDQQLKPCKCGYDICVWCWHHIMDMAEKDQTEGRCPACRTPYNKERIVGMAADCGKLVAEVSMEKKKSQKGKSKTLEGRKQLGSTRVIQKNVVYIVGLPLHLADEDLLQRKEYFGQYGKVQKVSISRTSAGAIQQYLNSTCSVYITYLKEEEAVRCIQAVHGFVLEDRLLKACFGTTKYCHAWLRNVPCSNPDCLYLHEIGSQEDSYTKDEIISAYSRVQQITGSTNSTQERMGNVLPPPADDYCNISSASTVKVTSKNATNIPLSNTKSSPPNSSSGRSVGLPAGALWGTRASNNLQPASLIPSNGQSKQKMDNGPVTFSAAVTNQNQSDVLKKQLPNGESHVNHDKNRIEIVESVQNNSDVDRRTTNTVDRRTTNTAITATVEPLVSSSVNIQLPPEKNGRCLSSPTYATIPVQKSCGSSLGKESDNTRVKVHNICSDVSSMNISEHEGILCNEYDHQFSEPITSYKDKKTSTSGVDTYVLNEKSDPGLHSGLQQSHLVSHEFEDDVVAFNNQRLKDPELVTDRVYMQNLTQSFHPSIYSSDDLKREASSSLALGVNFHPVNNIVDTVAKTSDIPVISTGYIDNQVNRYDGLGMRVERLFSEDDKRRHMESFQSASGSRDATEDIGENSIISDILSLDFDPWEQPLATRQNLSQRLRNNDHQQGSFVSSSRIGHSSSQSRFSFAREEQLSQSPYPDSSLHYPGNTTENGHFRHDFTNDRSTHFDKYGMRNDYSFGNAEESDDLSGIYPYRSSEKLSVSRSQISAPPGFSPSNRAPPPGFASERVEQSFDPFSGNHLLDTSSLLRNQYQTSMAGNMASSGDIEFMDPAILAVGKGRLPVGLNNSGLDTRQSFSSQYSAYENEARLQLLMERSQQNQRYSDIGNNFTHLQDAYSIPSRAMEHTLTENLSPFSQLNYQNFSSVSPNGHLKGWNEVRSGNEFAMAELLRNERLRFNNFYAGHEESKFRVPSSGDIYNRTFGI